MDIAKRTELEILARQEPMNAVIDRGDSPVQLFYKDAVVFLTGGSGFIGKQFVEKLLRSCDVKRVYLLLRPKKGRTIEQRLAYIVKEPVYDILRKKKPYFADKISVVEGDVAEINLGLSDKDWKILADEVNVIVHMAATVKFDEPLHRAALINVRGTREVINLAKACKNLKLFNHISTAFAHANASRINTDLREQFYPSPTPPDVLLNMVEKLDEEKMNLLAPGILQDWVNTYTFTKAIAEELIRTQAADLPVCIVKPPVVTSSYVEPTPGWIDGSVMSSPIGFVLGCGLGVIHVMLMEADNELSHAPVDYVNNAIIAAGWDSVENYRKNSSEIPLYTVSSSDRGFKFKYFGEILRKDEFRRMSSPKMLWYAEVVETSSLFLFWVLTWLLHYIPAYIIDALIGPLGIRPKGLPPLVKIYNKIYKLTLVYKFFLANKWYFRDHNLNAMIKRMSPEDKAIYNCNIHDVDYKQLTKAWCVGLRRYIMKDNLEGSDKAYRKQIYLKYANYLILTVYGYFIWKIVYTVFSTVLLFV